MLSNFCQLCTERPVGIRAPHIISSVTQNKRNALCGPVGIGLKCKNFSCRCFFGCDFCQYHINQFFGLFGGYNFTYFYFALGTGFIFCNYAVFVDTNFVDFGNIAPLGIGAFHRVLLAVYLYKCCSRRCGCFCLDFKTVSNVTFPGADHVDIYKCNVRRSQGFFLGQYRGAFCATIHSFNIFSDDCKLFLSDIRYRSL